MKWLFTLLVAVNIAVFGIALATRNGTKTEQASAAKPLEGGVHELALPESIAKNGAVKTESPEWMTHNAAAASEPEPEEAAAERRRQEQEEKLKAAKEKEKEKAAKEKEAAKAKELKDKKEREAKEAENQEKNPGKDNAAQKAGVKTNEKPAAKVQQICSATAAIALDEDDYHRLKGLLNRWPHSARRTIEQRTAQKAKKQAEKTYRVLVNSGGDVVSKLDSLSAKGFNGTLHNGEISVGITRSRSSAQVLISRLAAAGFGGTRIAEQEDGSNTVSDKSLSVARMHVTFTQVDSQSAQDIQAVVGRYGNLNVRGCK